ncbi:MAG TPA: CoA-binding protein [Bacteroidales bacterium]|nr:CoA-binding protein [Bacteroidales bacterium]
MITKTQIEDFYKQGTIAIIGVSRNKKKFGRTVYDELKKKGISVVPVNPNTDNIEGEKCYKDIAALPQEIKAAVLLTSKPKTLEALQQCVGKGMTNIWIQQGSHTKEALEFAGKNNVNLIHGKCIMMFSEPDGMHKLHRGIVKFFGRLPK